MSRKKKSFVLYFDSFLSIAPLAPEQRGWLLSAIFTYAMKAAEQRKKFQVRAEPGLKKSEKRWRAADESQR